jgi:hypothetical protein
MERLTLLTAFSIVHSTARVTSASANCAGVYKSVSMFSNNSTIMATNNEMKIKFIEAMAMVNVTTYIPKTKEYRLRYFFGTWMTSSIIFAENDAEAIHDADEVYNRNGNLADWQYPVALFCGNRKVKEYNCRSIYGTIK